MLQASSPRNGQIRQRKSTPIAFQQLNTDMQRLDSAEQPMQSSLPDLSCRPHAFREDSHVLQLRCTHSRLSHHRRSPTTTHSEHTQMLTRGQENSIINSQLQELVYRHPAVLPLFDKYNIDFCCHGTRTLIEALGHDKAHKLAGLIDEQIKTHKYGVLPQELDEDQVKMLGTSELIDYIVARFHEKTRREEPICKHLARMLYQTHGDERPELKEIKDLVKSVFDDLLKHINEEENYLFPKMRDFAHKPDREEKDTIVKFAMEHNDMFEQFQLLKKLTNSYTPQDPNCWSETRLLMHLKEMDMDAQAHTQIENYHLYNKVTNAHIKMEQRENQLNQLNQQMQNLPATIEPGIPANSTTTIDAFIRRINRAPTTWDPTAADDEIEAPKSARSDEEETYEKRKEVLSVDTMRVAGSSQTQTSDSASPPNETFITGLTETTPAPPQSATQTHKPGSLTWSDVIDNPRHLLKMEVYLFHYKLRHAIRQNQEHLVELMFQLMKERQLEKNEKRHRKRAGGLLMPPSQNGLNSPRDDDSDDDDMLHSRIPTLETTSQKIPLSSRSNDSSTSPYVSLELQLDLLPNEPCPLHVACETGHHSIVQLALKYYHVNTVDPVTHKTPLHVAIENQHKQIAVLLAKCGADVAYQSDLVESPLTTAVYVGSESLVEMLLFQFKANPNDEFKDIRHSPMYACCKTRHALIFEILRKAGCNVDCTGGYLQQTALHQLVQDLDLEGCRMILEKKKYRADIYLEDRNGYSAIHIAASTADFPEMIKLLVKFGADPDLMSSAVGRIATPLSLAVSNGFYKNAQALVALGANINRPMKSVAQDKKTVLSYAVELGNEDIVSLFLRNDADLETPVNRTPLYLSCKMGILGITKLLLDAGANTEVVDVKHKFTPLMIATQKGHEKIVRLLLKYKCNVNHLSVDHETALHVAARRGSARIVTDLLKYKVDALIKNEYRQTALHISCEEKHFDIVEILLRWNIASKRNTGAGRGAAHVATSSGAGGGTSITAAQLNARLQQLQQRTNSPQKLMKKVRSLVTPVRHTRHRPQWRHTISTLNTSGNVTGEGSFYATTTGDGRSSMMSSVTKLPPLYG